jgi:hypothetical protein
MRAEWSATGLENRVTRKGPWFDSTFFRHVTRYAYHVFEDSAESFKSVGVSWWLVPLRRGGSGRRGGKGCHAGFERR